MPGRPAIFLVWFSAIQILAAPALGADYYADQNSLGGRCSDENPGTIAAPWCTLEPKASGAARAGDTVFVREGIYDNQRIVPENSGSSENPVVFARYREEEAVIVGKWGHGATIKEVDHVVLDGLVFDGHYRHATGIYLDDHADHVTIRNTAIRRYSHPTSHGGMGLWVGRGGASHLLIENCVIHDIARGAPEDVQNGSGIHLMSNPDNPTSHVTIRNTEIYDVFTEDAIHLGAFGIVTDVLIEGCRFWDNKEDAIDMKLVERVTIRDCVAWGHYTTVTGGGAGVVIHSGSRQVLIDQCWFHDNDQGISVHFNKGDRAVEDIVIQRSILSDNRKNGIFVGDQQEEMVANVRILNNVVYNNGADGLFVYNGPDPVEMKNNILWNNANRDTVYHSIGKHTDLSSDYNCYPGGGKIYAGGRIRTVAEFRAAYPAYEQHALDVDPAFKDAASRDFHLTAGSPVIDQGIDVGLAYRGSAPDLGAFEFEEAVDGGMDGAPADDGAPPGEDTGATGDADGAADAADEIVDAGVSADTGDAGGGEDSSGVLSGSCGCAQSPAAPVGLALGLAVLGWCRRRRRD